MKKSMSMRIEEMKKLEMTLEAGANWETCCGYSINGELEAFINMNDGLDLFSNYEEELKYA